ncbi:phosphopantetheinyl transferase [Microdochium bolleyi]|uniref:holo-[acyl-carrier-protein] synthase n=1 Tax=Microdochium bolleyi TaxID=196109 RepID=A0A136JA03_9PEZI|nr:phosphopantetheinyl transferase [Microdochium bolleyi]
MTSTSGIRILQYLVDTRPLWPEASKTKDLEHVTTRALDLLTSDERSKVLKFYFVADAKMALVSHLLKHWVVSTTCNIPWSQTVLSRDQRGKPIFTRSSSTGEGAITQPVTFNVSHQAGLVSLVAATAASGSDVGSLVDVGTDIVCTSERHDRDHKMIREQGWAEFVDMHAEVFGRAETEYLKHGDLLAASGLAGRSASSAGVIDAKLRAFYALWCYREAYVKMTGDALLATWLNDLEFRDFRAPEKGGSGGLSSSAGSASFTQVGQPESQVQRDCVILLHGQEVDDANVCLRSLGADYMTCSAIRTPKDKQVGRGIELGAYEWLSLETILQHAEAAGG